MEIHRMLKEGCSSQCSFGRDCLKHVDIEYLGDLCKQFWGAEEEAPKLPKERYASIDSIYKTLKAGFNVSQFIYQIKLQWDDINLTLGKRKINIRNYWQNWQEKEDMRGRIIIYTRIYWFATCKHGKSTVAHVQSLIQRRRVWYSF